MPFNQFTSVESFLGKYNSKFSLLFISSFISIEQYKIAFLETQGISLPVLNSSMFKFLTTILIWISSGNLF